MAALGTPEILIIAVVIMTLFGARRLPDSARALGRSMRIFKAETKGLRDDDTVVEPLPLTTANTANAANTASPLFDQYTGKPLDSALPVDIAKPRFDPQTGLPIAGSPTDRPL